MPDFWMDVDVALSEVPVNIMALLDDTDYKTRETAIAYNAAGMDLVWNFLTPAGAFTQTAVTPTTGGNYDWTHQGDGIYTIEIPASGGASINNDTEGFGWFTGFVTGVLPWRGPTIGFRRAALNDLLIEGGTASTNLEDFFDGTGYAGGTAKLTVNAVQLGGAPVTATTSVTIPAASTLATTTGAVGSVTGAVGSVTGAVGSVTGAVGSVTGAVGSVTGNVGGNVVGSVASVTAGVTVTTNNDKTGYGLSSAAVQAIWDALTSALTTVGSIGKKLADWVIGTTQTGDSFARLGAPAGASVSADIAAIKSDTAAILVDTGTTLDGRIPAALVAGRMDASVGAMAANTLTASALATDAVTEIQSGLSTVTTGDIPTAAANADAVWDEAIAGHLGAGSTGAALNAAGSAGDPWTTPLPGAYGAGTAGKIIGDNINATVSSRSSHSAADVWAAVTRTLTAASDSSGITTLLTRIVGTLATGTHEPQSGDAYARLGAPAGASVSADIAAIEAQTDDIGVAGAGLTALGDTRLANLDAAVSSRSTYAGGAVASVTGAVGSVTAAVTVGTNSDKTGYALTAAYDPAKTAAQAGDAMALTSGERTTLTAAIWAYVVEGTHTAVQYMRLMAAALFAKLSGAATTTVTIRDVDDTKARITATVDADGNRTAITSDGT